MRRGRVFLIALAGLIADSSPVLAYLDPGTGSLVLQGLIAALAASAAAVSLSWDAVKNVASRLFARKRRTRARSRKERAK
jgi:hypothetical protein